jgi:hypothetical protein
MAVGRREVCFRESCIHNESYCIKRLRVRCATRFRVMITAELDEAGAKSSLDELQKQYATLVVSFKNQQAELLSCQAQLLRAENELEVYRSAGETGGGGASVEIGPKRELEKVAAVRAHLSHHAGPRAPPLTMPYCHLPLPAAACRCLPLPAAACRCLPLPAAACRCLPLHAALPRARARTLQRPCRSRALPEVVRDTAAHRFRRLRCLQRFDCRCGVWPLLSGRSQAHPCCRPPERVSSCSEVL